MRMKHRYLFFASLVFVLSACTSDTVTDDTTIDNGEPIIRTRPNINYEEYINRFASEALVRNVGFVPGSVNLVISDTLNFYCGWGDPRNSTVQISRRPECWSERNDTEKEILMFHEIGHASLERQHDNTLLPNGDFKSMMTGGDGGGPLFAMYTKDTPEKREYYLDELLDPNTPVPVWASAKVNPTILLNDSINSNDTDWEFSNTTGSTHLSEISSTSFSTPGSSLKISATETSEFSFWRYRLTPEGIEQGSRLVMEVDIQLENVTNDGIYIAIRGDSADDVVFFNTTQGRTTINGTSSFTTYTVEIPYYIETVETINLFLILSGDSTGTVYFDDIKLISYN